MEERTVAIETTTQDYDRVAYRSVQDAVNSLNEDDFEEIESEEYDEYEDVDLVFEVSQMADVEIYREGSLLAIVESNHIPVSEALNAIVDGNEEQLMEEIQEEYERKVITFSEEVSH